MIDYMNIIIIVIHKNLLKYIIYNICLNSKTSNNHFIKLPKSFLSALRFLKFVLILVPGIVCFGL